MKAKSSTLEMKGIEPLRTESNRSAISCHTSEILNHHIITKMLAKDKVGNRTHAERNRTVLGNIDCSPAAKESSPDFPAFHLLSYHPCSAIASRH